eukprot:1955336-Rhodomonas_salina.1
MQPLTQCWRRFQEQEDPLGGRPALIPRHQNSRADRPQCRPGTTRIAGTPSKTKGFVSMNEVSASKNRGLGIRTTGLLRSCSKSQSTLQSLGQLRAVYQRGTLIESEWRDLCADFEHEEHHVDGGRP